jgi:structural maintenance of chromosome 3 (chondroitin sulfate proteoglycan 6)
MQNALPMQTVIYCDDKFDIIRRSVFSRAMVCRDMQVGTMIAKENRLDCVTLEGDLLSSF